MDIATKAIIFGEGIFVLPKVLLTLYFDECYTCTDGPSLGPRGEVELEKRGVI